MLNKNCKNSKKYNINRYRDRIELFDKITHKFVVKISKEEIKKSQWILKLL